MKKSKSWITADTWKKIENRRAMKTMVDDAKSSRQKALKKEEYQRLDKRSKIQSKERYEGMGQQHCSRSRSCCKTRTDEGSL